MSDNAVHVHMYIFFKVILNIEKMAFWTARRGESLRRRAIVFLIPILKVKYIFLNLWILFFSGRVKLYLTYSMPNILCRVELHLNWFSETCSVILSECNFSQRKLPELGTRQHCRDSVTMFSGQKWLIIALCLPSVWLLHLYTETLLLLIFFHVPDALLHCRIVTVALSLSRSQLCPTAVPLICDK